MPQLPKLSYVLLSHNREKYIRAAIESAFAQDYEGELEYIFSDDCSTDRTFEIIKECVAAYKGNRRVVVTQPPTNLRTAGNFNHALSFVQSDWIVRADDDDLSVVDRCTVIGKVINAVPGCTYIATEASKYFTDNEEQAAVAESRTPCGTFMHPRVVDIREASPDECAYHAKTYSYKAWSMEAYRAFGELPLDAYWADDYIFYFRTAVLGKGVLVDNAVAVLIRNGSGNQSRGDDDNARDYRAIIRLEQFNDKYYNLTYAPMLATYNQLKDYVEEHFSAQEKEAAAPFMADFAINMEHRDHLRSYWRKGTLNRLKICREMGYPAAFTMLYCLPMPIYAGLLSIIRKLKGKS
ncbi:MAG: glycosyltransferase family 2 protein [Akkermansia sp.]|nr:glycosyltransferase family 2 protein [Akkermansia sp.]